MLLRFLFCTAVLFAQGDPFAGTFSNEVFTLELRREGTAYVGTIRAQGESMPVRAAAAGERLAGSFGSGGSRTRLRRCVRRRDWCW
jgi:hypothetical protein